MARASKVMEEKVVGLKQFKEALTSIAVIVSFMVVLLAVYTMISERTREIGPRKETVVDYVVAESFLICVVGGDGIRDVGAGVLPSGSEAGAQSFSFASCSRID
jgi:hypothetical protein